MNTLIVVQRISIAILLSSILSVSPIYAAETAKPTLVAPTSSQKATTPSPAPEAQKAIPVAQVIWTKGGVTAEQPNLPPRILERRSPIFEKDTIVTDKEGSAQIAFTDSGMVSLRSDTQFRIDKFSHKVGAPPAEEKSVMSIIKGGFRTITGVVPKENPEGYQVNTPVATIGVRGTDYSIFYTMQQGLAVKIDLGKIAIQNEHGVTELDKATNKVYAMVHLNTAPQAVNNLPSKLFKEQPSIQPVSSKVINSIGTTAVTIPTSGPTGGGAAGGANSKSGTGTSDTGTGSTTTNPQTPSSGPAKTVSNFCIGLLKNMNDFLSHLFV